MKLSITMGGQNISICQGEYASNKLKVTNCQSLPLAEGLVNNGIVRDIPAAAKVLRETLQKGGFTAKEACISLSSTAITFRELTLPVSPAKKMPYIVRNELTQAVGLAADTVVDYLTLSVSEDKKQERILAMALSKQVVEGYHEMLRAAGLKPKQMDICPNALVKLLSLYPEQDSSGFTILVNIESAVLTTTLVQTTRIVFTRLTRLSPTHTAFGEDVSLRTNEIGEAISKMVQFLPAYAPGEHVQRVLLSGDLAGMGSLGDALQMMLDIPCLFFPATARIQGTNLDVAQYASVLGALISRR